MKTSIFLLSLLSLLSMTHRINAHNTDSLYKVELKGKVLIPGQEQNKSYCIELMRDNLLVESSGFTDGESFLLRLQDNTQYTVRILKQGYLPMVVTLDTHVKDNEDHNYRFDADFFVRLYGFTLSLSMDKPDNHLAMNDK